MQTFFRTWWTFPKSIPFLKFIKSIDERFFKIDDFFSKLMFLFLKIDEVFFKINAYFQSRSICFAKIDALFSKWMNFLKSLKKSTNMKFLSIHVPKNAKLVETPNHLTWCLKLIMQGHEKNWDHLRDVEKWATPKRTLLA